MKGTWKRILSLLLVCTLLAANIPQNVFAKEKAPEFTYTHVNPLYADVLDEQEIETPSVVKSSERSVSTYASQEFLTDDEEIAACIREAMRNRQTEFNVYINADDITQERFDLWIDLAFKETDNPKEGDYLERHYARIGSSYSGISAPSSSEYMWDFTATFSVSYYTTLAQEEELDAAVEQVMNEIGVSTKNNDYTNLKLIYDYICDNIVYDYDNLYDNSHLLKYTAYAAMVNKTAVCQGYASLLYYMGRLAGLDMRTISGYANNGRHGWNIVKMGDLYYNLDSTWDAGRNTYNYFLVGTNHFKDHTSNDKYLTEEFMTQYPISLTDYVYVEPEDDRITIENSVGEDSEKAENLYVGDEKIVIAELNRENYAGSENEQPIVEEHLFAGWFSDEACTTPFTGTEGTAYAKFVDENVLKVMAQTTSGIRDAKEGKMRLISSVDSANYQNVGFYIEIEGVKKPIDANLKKVYKKFYALNKDGSKTYYTPEMISNLSVYFVAFTIEGIPQGAHNSKFEITPYWTTKDGTYVEGQTYTKVVSQMPGYDY